MRVAVCVVLLSVVLGGCSHIPRTEYAWQSIHLVDVLQTLDGPARDPCYEEADGLTRRLIGRQPSESDVIVWGIAIAAVHAGVTSMLERVDAPTWAKFGWQALTITNTAQAVRNNYSEGIRLGRSNDRPQAADHACRFQ